MNLQSSKRYFVDLGVVQARLIQNFVTPSDPEAVVLEHAVGGRFNDFEATMDMPIAFMDAPRARTVMRIQYPWLDSKEDNPEIHSMILNYHPDGKRYIRTGTVADPGYRNPQVFAENWANTDVHATEREPPGRPCCIVLRTTSDSAVAEGLIVRVGQYCQGIIKVDGEMSAERWYWDEFDEWERLFHIGPQFIPCAMALDNETRKGAILRFGAIVWEVCEVSRW
jgi:hypothetical protein